MNVLQAVLSFLVISNVAADDFANVYTEEDSIENKYAYALNDIKSVDDGRINRQVVADTDLAESHRIRRQTDVDSDLAESHRIRRQIDVDTDLTESHIIRRQTDVDTDLTEIGRSRRQASTQSEAYYVTQCSHDNVEEPAGPSIQVLGVSLNYPAATKQAAKLLHLIVRFMPRPLYLKIASLNTVGLFSTSSLPAELFDDFNDMPAICEGRCGLQMEAGVEVDCDVWCTTDEYPYPNFKKYPINFLWAYGNFSRLVVADTNIVCQGYNPAGSQNLLIKEFGFMMMTRILEDQTISEIENAYLNANVTGTWDAFENKYEYFMLATLAWFNGYGLSYQDTKKMLCQNIRDDTGLPLCADAFQQRQYIKEHDIKLYTILKYIYNNNREHVNSDTSMCEW